MISGIEHVAIASPDPERLGRWYVEHLGFTVNYFSASSRTTFVKAPDGSMIEIVSAQGERGGEGMRVPGLRHLALATRDFAGDCARLQAAGVEFVTEPENSKGNQVVFFRDADGNLLHLIQREKPLP